MKFRSVIVIIGAAALSALVHAQAQLDPALLGKPPVSAWPTYHGDYSGRHYSTLSQINQANVKNLGLAWVYRANTNVRGAETGGSVPEALPIHLGPGALAGGLLKSTP